MISIMNSVLITSVCNAQALSERVLEDIIEESSVNNDVEEPDWEDELEELSRRLREPLDMNTATRDQLRQFPFLTDLQIEKSVGLYLYKRTDADCLRTAIGGWVRPQNNRISAAFRLCERYQQSGRFPVEKYVEKQSEIWCA